MTHHNCAQLIYTKVVFVGGGASLFPADMLPKNWVIPQSFSIANAYGAALAEVSATIDRVISFEKGREAVINQLKEAVFSIAHQKGTKNPRVIEQYIFPYHYLPGQLARVVMTVSGHF